MSRPLRIVATINCVQISLIVYAKTQRRRIRESLEKQYTNNMSDYEIDYFHNHYKQLHEEKYPPEEEEKE